MRYRKIAGRAAAFLAAAALIGTSPEVTAFAGQRREAQGSWQEPGQDEEVPYGERNYEGVDLTRLEQLLGQLEQSCQGQAVMGTAQDQETSGDSVRIYRQVLRELDWAATQMALADILYSRNMEDAALSAQYEDAAGKTQEAMEMVLLSFQRALQMPGGAVLKEEMGPEIAGAVERYEPASDNLIQLWSQELELMLRYNQAYSEGAVVNVDGQDWDYAALDEAGLNYEDYERIYMELEKENNRRLGEIYLDLVQVRDQIARESGYDTYSDYAYEAVYGRDFTPEDTETLYGPIKDSALLLLEDCWYAQDEDVSDAVSQDTEELLDQVQSCVEDMDQELGETFSYMRRLGLYDMDWSGENKSRSGSFTIDMPYYGDAFVFLTKDSGFQDFFSLAHEFGHFASVCRENTPWLYQASYTDVCEIQSQGLELLMLHYRDSLFGELAADAQLQNVGNAMDSIVVGAMLDEFETWVYDHPDMSLEELNWRFGQINGEYDQWYFTNDQDGLCYSWVNIGHLFQNPLYYISYATSAYPALELWLDSQTDWQGAVDRYMELSALGVSQPYQMAVDTCGLGSIFEENAIGRLTERVGRTLELDSYGEDEEIPWDGPLPREEEIPPDIEENGASGNQGMKSLARLLIMGLAAVMELQLACFAVGAVILWEIRRRKQ